MNRQFDFDYLIEKIRSTEFKTEPFKHLYIEDFFSGEHLEDIKSSTEIASPQADNDQQLIDGLTSKGFKPIKFPGCVTDIKAYTKWHSKKENADHHSATEGFGMALRLFSFDSPILSAVNEFIGSDKFNKAIAEKFSIEFKKCKIDGGVQKYLDGYEISPHPDIRRKAATFMININPSDESESLDHHTHYLRLKPDRQYVETLWEGNPQVDRAWVPWDWAETVYQQVKNNSIVLFSPSNDTLHGVKASYNHLQTQRTQLYGNLWYRERERLGTVNWEAMDFQVSNIKQMKRTKAKSRVLDLIPDIVKAKFKTP